MTIGCILPSYSTLACGHLKFKGLGPRPMPRSRTCSSSRRDANIDINLKETLMTISLDDVSFWQHELGNDKTCYEFTYCHFRIEEYALKL